MILEINTPVAGPSFEELNITPPPVTDQAAYNQWAESYGDAYRKYLEASEAPQETDPSLLLVKGTPKTIEEENWLENELQVRKINVSVLTQDDLYQLTQELLEEYRAQ